MGEDEERVAEEKGKSGSVGKKERERETKRIQLALICANCILMFYKDVQQSWYLLMAIYIYIYTDCMYMVKYTPHIYIKETHVYVQQRYVSS